jgi:hypothetical protein
MTESQRDAETQADAAANGQLKTPVEARQAVKTHHVRWMLVVSLSLGVIAVGGVGIWYAAQPHTGSTSVAEDGR